MAIPKLTEDLNIIQKLPDLPNSEGGMTADELKAEFDASGLAIQKFINEKLTPALVAAKIPFAPTNEINEETIQAAIENVQAQVKDAASGTIVNGSVTKEKLSSELLARTYGGRSWVSVDTPDSSDNVATDFPIGQTWLRPAFTLENVATEEWSAVACSVAVDGYDVTITGTQTIATATAVQNLYNIGVEGDRVFVLFDVADKDVEISSLTMSINGAESVDVGIGGAFEAQLMASGGLGVLFSIGWPSTSLASGSVTIANFTVVNVSRVLRQMTESKDMADWASYLLKINPFTTYESPEALFIHRSNGDWAQIAYFGELENDKYIRTTRNGAFKLMDRDEVAADIGALRMKTGSYTGNGAERTLDLGFEPKMIYIYPVNGPIYKVSSSEYSESSAMDNPIFLAQGATKKEFWTANNPGYSDHKYFPQVKLSGSTLTFEKGRIIDLVGYYLGNRSGETYNWVALY